MSSCIFQLMSLRQFPSLLSKLNISWHRLTASTRCLMSSKPIDTAESALDDNNSSSVENELSNAVMDAANKEQPILPYSQKALETLKLDKYPYYVEREWWKHGNRMTFWSTWRMKRDVKRRHLLAELGPDRVRLKALKCNTILPEMIRDECAKKLHNFPKGSCPSLIQHLCQFSGARRGPLCAELYFLASKSVELPDPATTFLSNIDLMQANKYMLGLTAEAPQTWTSDGDVLKRPRALAVVTVIDGKVLNNLSPPTYTVSTKGENFDHEELVYNKIFDGEKQEWILMRNAELQGSQIAADAQNIFSKFEVMTKSEPLRQEIENLYKIAESLKRSEIASTKNTPTIFIIDVNGLPTAERELSEKDYNEAIDELENAILHLISVLRNVYNDRVIAELIAESMNEVKQRQKRQFASTGYPAMFGIFLFVTVALALVILFVTVGLWNMDPGKDSIIYRVVTTRMKKD
ncbi:renin receptor-like protein [Onchocerca flexuosa]|uniref:Renin receptor-like protein n=1 Tax=Onchocerca flexuosa TaxID=387005 RepID=A0A238BTS8_9BILA|nr:renin receptor-like protein [Onchocerca flexuosa]